MAQIKKSVTIASMPIQNKGGERPCPEGNRPAGTIRRIITPITNSQLVPDQSEKASYKDVSRKYRPNLCPESTLFPHITKSQHPLIWISVVPPITQPSERIHTLQKSARDKRQRMNVANREKEASSVKVQALSTAYSYHELGA